MYFFIFFFQIQNKVSRAEQTSTSLLCFAGISTRLLFVAVIPVMIVLVGLMGGRSSAAACSFTGCFLRLRLLSFLLRGIAVIRPAFAVMAVTMIAGARAAVFMSGTGFGGLCVIFLCYIWRRSTSLRLSVGMPVLSAGFRIAVRLTVRSVLRGCVAA